MQQACSSMYYEFVNAVGDAEEQTDMISKFIDRTNGAIINQYRVALLPGSSLQELELGLG